jgi:hypothetical protein
MVCLRTRWAFVRNLLKLFPINADEGGELERSNELRVPMNGIRQEMLDLHPDDRFRARIDPQEQIVPVAAIQRDTRGGERFTVKVAEQGVRWPSIGEFHLILRQGC